MALSKAYKAQWLTLQWVAMNYGVILTEDEVIDLFAPLLKSRFQTPQRPVLYRNSYRFGIMKGSERGDALFDVLYEGPWKDTGIEGYTLAEPLGKVQITSVKWNLRKKDKTAVTQSDVDFVRAALKKVGAFIRTEIPSPSPTGARAKMMKWFDENKRALKRWGWTVGDLPTLQAWTFFYDASPYGTLPKWEYDRSKPLTPSLPKPRKKRAPKPIEEITAPPKKGALWGVAAIIAALALGQG